MSGTSPTVEIRTLTDSERRAFGMIGQTVECSTGSSQTGSGDTDPAQALDPLRADILQEIRHGKGWNVIRGLPVDPVEVRNNEGMLETLTTGMGVPVSQSAAGDRIGHVTDWNKGGGDVSARGYQSRRELFLHTDFTDILVLLCVRPAPSGGDSVLAAAADAYHAIRKQRPDLLAILEEGFRYHRRGEQAATEADITPYRLPVIRAEGSLVYCQYLREMIELAADKGRELSDLEKEALDFFDQAVVSPEVAATLRLKAGDAIVVNNHRALHARTSFKDGETLDATRHFLRLWLNAPDLRPASYDNRIYLNEENRCGIDPKQGGAAASVSHAVEVSQSLR